MTNADYSFIADLGALIDDIPPDAIISRTYHEDDRLKAILFAFAPGQELSEHTASQPAMLHFFSGEAELSLGEEAKTASAGTWVRMPAHLTHSVRARTEVLMLLLLYKQ